MWFRATGIVFALLAALVTAQAAEKPNIVVIVADDLGWNDVGWHGSEIPTPTLDRLVSSGIELDNHYVQPVCTPTRVALNTGRYPSRFSVRCTVPSNERSVPLGTAMMASLFKSTGYATALIGKWHLGSKPEWGPNHYGFDYSYGSLAGAVGMYDHRYRLKSPYVRTWHRNCEFIEDEKGHASDLVTREAVGWIEKQKDRPFLLCVTYHSVHAPLVEEDRWLAKVRHVKSADRRLYAAAVAHLDDCVSRIVDAIDRAGIRERTLIVFTSDNGAQVNHAGNAYPPPDPKLSNFSSNKPLRGHKAQTYEGGIRVPAFANWPGKLKPAKLRQPMHAVDWVPTLTRLVGVEPPENAKWDGCDVWPFLIDAGRATQTRTLYWVVSNRWFALRHGEWKIVRQGLDGKWELFNLADDPNETTDLASAKPEKLAELVGLFRENQAKDAPVVGAQSKPE